MSISYTTLITSLILREENAKLYAIRITILCMHSMSISTVHYSYKKVGSEKKLEKRVKITILHVQIIVTFDFVNQCLSIYFQKYMACFNYFRSQSVLHITKYVNKYFHSKFYYNQSINLCSHTGQLEISNNYLSYILFN